MKKIILILITLFIIGCESFGVFKHEHENIKGCTNKNAFNYNNIATKEDGSCLFEIYYKIDPICPIDESNYYDPVMAWSTPNIMVTYNGYMMPHANENSAQVISTEPSISECKAIISPSYIFPQNAYLYYDFLTTSIEPPLNNIFPKFITYISGIPVDTVLLPEDSGITGYSLITNLLLKNGL